MQVELHQTLEKSPRNSFQNEEELMESATHALSISDLCSIKKYVTTMTTILEAAKLEYTIEKVAPGDDKEIIDFLKTTFFKNEPMNNYLDLGDCPELEEWAEHYIHTGCSYKAVNSKGEIIGIILNGIVLRQDEINDEQKSTAADCKHEQFRKILTLFEYIDTQYTLFNYMPNLDKALDIKILSVCPKYGGLGIGQKLINASIDWMKENNVSVVHCMCSSHFSARLCRKIGMKLVYTLNFIDYVVNGENPIRPAEPHNGVEIYLKEI